MLTLHSPEGTVLKPDLVVKIQEGVDVTVRHEDYLQMGTRSKLDKYAPPLRDLQARFQSERAEVLPIVIGTKRALPKRKMDALDKLHINECSD
jgi:hypothetical protein